MLLSFIVRYFDMDKLSITLHLTRLAAAATFPPLLQNAHLRHHALIGIPTASEDLNIQESWLER